MLGFKNEKMTVVGIEPSKNIADIAIKNGIETISEFFDDNSINKINIYSYYTNLFDISNLSTFDIDILYNTNPVLSSSYKQKHNNKIKLNIFQSSKASPIG